MQITSKLQSHLSELNQLQDDVIKKMQTRRKYDLGMDCKPLDFKAASKIEITEQVVVTDLSTDEQVFLGINMFKVDVGKTTYSPLHEHKNQAQLIHVKKGSIYDNVSKMRFEAGQSFFISKNNTHSLKFIKGSIVIFIFMPSLTILEDDN